MLSTALSIWALLRPWERHASRIWSIMEVTSSVERAIRPLARLCSRVEVRTWMVRSFMLSTADEIRSLPRVCSRADDAIWPTISSTLVMASLMLWLPRACSTVARAISLTWMLAFWTPLTIFSRAAPERWESFSPSEIYRSARLIASTAREVSFCTPLMTEAISRVELLVRSESSRISSATTANPLPCSPAWAAMMAALRANRLVCSATSSMTERILPMSLALSDRFSMTSAVMWDERRMSCIPAMASSAAFLPVSASFLTPSEMAEVSLALFSTCLMVASISAMEEAVVLEAPSRLAMLTSICLMDEAISMIEELTSSTVPPSISAFRATSSMLAAISRIEEDVSEADTESLSMSFEMSWTDLLMSPTAWDVSATVTFWSLAELTTWRDAFSMLLSMEVNSSEAMLTRETMLCRFSAMVFMAVARAPVSPPALISRRLSSLPSATVRAKTTHSRSGLVMERVIRDERTANRKIITRPVRLVVMILAVILEDT